MCGGGGGSECHRIVSMVCFVAQSLQENRDASKGSHKSRERE